MKYVFWMLLLNSALCFSNERFLLKSELHTQYGDNSFSQSFSAFYYDRYGNRIQIRSFTGADSNSSLMSSTVHAYDNQNRCIQSISLNSSGDTLSNIHYKYNNTGLTSSTTLRGNGSISFKDSSIYTDGLLTELRRYNETGEILFFRRFSYSNGLLRADSIFERQTGFTATQSRIIARNADKTVSSETIWQVSNQNWYCISTTTMDYASGNLISATKYENDGTTRLIIDSLSYLYDENGNCIKSVHFDNDRNITYDIVFTWFEPESHLGTVAKVSLLPRFHITVHDGQIIFGKQIKGTVAFCRPDGKLVYQQCIQKKKQISFPASIASGRYIVVIHGDINHSQSLTIYQ